MGAIDSGLKAIAPMGRSYRSNSTWPDAMNRSKPHGRPLSRGWAREPFLRPGFAQGERNQLPFQALAEAARRI